MVSRPLQLLVLAMFSLPSCQGAALIGRVPTQRWLIPQRTFTKLIMRTRTLTETAASSCYHVTSDLSPCPSRSVRNINPTSTQSILQTGLPQVEDNVQKMVELLSASSDVTWELVGPNQDELRGPIEIEVHKQHRYEVSADGRDGWGFFNFDTTLTRVVTVHQTKRILDPKDVVTMFISRCGSIPLDVPMCEEDILPSTSVRRLMTTSSHELATPSLDDFVAEKQTTTGASDRVDKVEENVTQKQDVMEVPESREGQEIITEEYKIQDIVSESIKTEDVTTEITDVSTEQIEIEDVTENFETVKFITESSVTEKSILNKLETEKMKLEVATTEKVMGTEEIITEEPKSVDSVTDQIEESATEVKNIPEEVENEEIDTEKIVTEKIEMEKAERQIEDTATETIITEATEKIIVTEKIDMNEEKVMVTVETISPEEMKDAVTEESLRYETVTSSSDFTTLINTASEKNVVHVADKSPEERAIEDTISAVRAIMQSSDEVSESGINLNAESLKQIEGLQAVLKEE